MKSWDDIRPDPLTFPIGGKVYTVPELPYTAMLTIQRAKAGESTELDDMTAEDTWRIVMGATWDEMVADNVPAEAISRAGLATLAYFEMGVEAAEAIWEHGIDPKAIAAAMTVRASLSEQSSTDEASATPQPARLSGTSSRPSSSKKSSRAKGSRS
jgi:hypothetical protein